MLHQVILTLSVPCGFHPNTFLATLSVNMWPIHFHFLYLMFFNISHSSDIFLRSWFDTGLTHLFIKFITSFLLILLRSRSHSHVITWLDKNLSFEEFVSLSHSHTHTNAPTHTHTHTHTYIYMGACVPTNSAVVHKVIFLI